MPVRLFLFLLLAGSLFAQAPKEIPKFELSAIQLGEMEIPPLYYTDVKRGTDGKEQRTFVPFPLSNGIRGPVEKISFVPPVKLYTGQVDTTGKPDMKPFLDVPADSPKDRLLLVFYLDREGRQKHGFLNDSETAHPQGSVRVANFDTGSISFFVGGPTIQVPPHGEAKAVPVINAEGRFPFVHFVDRPGQPQYQAPLKLLRFRSPDQRLLVLYTAMPVGIASGDEGAGEIKIGFEPVASRLYDTIGKPGTAVVDNKPQTPAQSSPTTPRPAPSPAAQDQEVVLLALGDRLSDLEGIQIEWEGIPQKTSATLQAGEFLPLRAPVTGGVSLSLTSGNSLGSAHLSPASRQHLVVLVPGEESDSPMYAMAFENSLQSHPAGGTRVFNLTPYQLAYSVGKEVAYVNPKEQTLITFPPGQSDLKLAVKGIEGWKIVLPEKPVVPEAGKRTALFVYKLPGKNEFNVLEKTQ